MSDTDKKEVREGTDEQTARETLEEKGAKPKTTAKEEAVEDHSDNAATTEETPAKPAGDVEEVGETENDSDTHSEKKIAAESADQKQESVESKEGEESEAAENESGNPEMSASEDETSASEEAPTSEQAPKDEGVKVEKEEIPAEKVGKTEKLSSTSETFDWESLTEEDVTQTPEYQKLAAEYTETLTQFQPHSVVNGTVVGKTRKEVVVNINYKSEGVINANEFRYNPDLAIGDTVEVYIETLEDKDGQLVVSHAKARTMRAWERVNEAHEKDEIITGFVKCRTKGGMIVDVFGLESFLPGSQIDVKPIRDYDEYVEKNLELKVVKINQEFKNVVVSHKALIEAELEAQKAEIMSKLEKGQVLEGLVKNITSYGVFVDLGGVDGLVHITDLSWGRINHPEEIVELDQKINVVILDFDDQKKRIALGLKQLTKHPWDSLSDDLKEGEVVKGKVVVLQDYGAFVEIQEGVEGLIHVSEMSWSQHLRSAQDFFKIGDEVEAIIMSIDREERKMSLSTRRMKPDPWDDIEAKYPIQSRNTGKVTNTSNFGVFVELEEGIDGLVHISDLSWTKKVGHPNEFVKVGDPIDVIVLEIDKENRRMALGHKQIEENPWEVFESVFTIGSIHEGTLVSANDKGGTVVLPYGIEGFAPGKHLVKESGGRLKVDEKADFKILEFNKDSRKIIVSHARIYEDVQERAKGGGTKARKTSSKSTRKNIRQVQENLEKTTLGDLDVLAGLKTDMEAAEKKGKGAGKKKKKKKSPEDGESELED